jgi:hypothetical protein
MRVKEQFMPKPRHVVYGAALAAAYWFAPEDSKVVAAAYLVGGTAYLMWYDSAYKQPAPVVDNNGDVQETATPAGDSSCGCNGSS